jgi:hypothetical protein
MDVLGNLRIINIPRLVVGGVAVMILRRPIHLSKNRDNLQPPPRQ